MKSKLFKKLENTSHHFLLSIKEEAENTKESSLIIQKYFKEGKISKEEEIIVKKQLKESLKIIGVIIPFILIPGAAILMPILIKIAKKHNIDILPSSFDKKNKDERIKS